MVGWDVSGLGWYESAGYVGHGVGCGLVGRGAMIWAGTSPRAGRGESKHCNLASRCADRKYAVSKCTVQTDSEYTGIHI